MSVHLAARGWGAWLRSVVEMCGWGVWLSRRVVKKAGGCRHTGVGKAGD